MAPKRADRPILLAVTSDHHCGSTVALMPPKGVTTDDGQHLAPSVAQSWLFQCWRDFWSEADAWRGETDPELYMVLNGDLVEGDHHNTSQIVSRNPNAWADMIDATLDVPLAMKPDRIFVIRGTGSHVGEAGAREEAVAKRIGAEPDPETGRSSWYHLRMAPHDHPIDIAHHGRMGRRAYTEASQLALYAHDIWARHVVDGHKPPELVIRSHWHRMVDTGAKEGHRGTYTPRIITCGAWQLKTAYAHKVAPDSLADVGGWLVLITPEQIECRAVEFIPERGPIWKAA